MSHEQLQAAAAAIDSLARSLGVRLVAQVVVIDGQVTSSVLLVPLPQEAPPHEHPV